MMNAVLYAAIVVTGGLLGANVYNSVVDAPNWGAAVPGSIETARRYFATRNPGSFFRVASPLNLLLNVLVVAISWQAGGATRWTAVAALGFSALGEVFTFKYFFPRNTVLFIAPLDVAAASRAWTQWSAMNHPRSLLILGALLCELNLLTRFAIQG